MSADATMLYETLYSLASQDTESDLFGTSAPLAQKAFRRAAAGAATPTVWFEVPLSGQPRFDLHVAHSNADLHERAPFAPDAMDGHGELLNWYASEPREGGGLALLRRAHCPPVRCAARLREGSHCHGQLTVSDHKTAYKPEGCRF